MQRAAEETEFKINPNKRISGPRKAEEMLICLLCVSSAAQEAAFLRSEVRIFLNIASIRTDIYALTTRILLALLLLDLDLDPGHWS